MIEAASTEWVEYWRNYVRSTGTLTWRVATPDDLPAIRRLQNVSERFLKHPQRSPSFFCPPILLTLVAENKRGRIIEVLYVEAQVEISKVACSKDSFDESILLQEDLRPWLRSLGYRTALATAPHAIKDRMGNGLIAAGFRCLDAALSYWGRRL